MKTIRMLCDEVADSPRLVRALLLAVTLLAFAGTVAVAEDVPPETVSGPTTVLVPFRCWVAEHMENGILVGGHYEFFSIPLERDMGEVLASPKLVPAVPLVPNQGGRPAISTITAENGTIPAGTLQSPPKIAKPTPFKIKENSK